MPQPKKKTSNSKRNSRRQHWMRKVQLPTLVKCEQCSEPKPSHMVCTSCGHYKGREVFQVAEG